MRPSVEVSCTLPYSFSSSDYRWSNSGQGRIGLVRITHVASNRCLDLWFVRSQYLCEFCVSLGLGLGSRVKSACWCDWLRANPALFLAFFFLTLKKGFLFCSPGCSRTVCILGWPRTHRSTCLWLLSARIKGLPSQYSQLSFPLIMLVILNYVYLWVTKWRGPLIQYRIAKLK